MNTPTRAVEATGSDVDPNAGTLTFWGARGSIPVSGPDKLAYGGNTTTLEVVLEGRRLIVDAGTGIRSLGFEILDKGATGATLLFTHLHLDHVIGLSAFKPLFMPGFDLQIYLPRLSHPDPEGALRALLAAPYFPIAFCDVLSQPSVHLFDPGDRLAIDGFTVRTLPLSHPGGACGYRIDNAAGSVVVVTDHEHTGPVPEPDLVEFCRDAAVVVYDAHWDQDVDYEPHRGWGHSTWQAGLDLVRRSGAARLAAMHHSPHNPDAVLAERDTRLRLEHPPSFFAREGMTVPLGLSARR